jgi:hypothetical protein
LRECATSAVASAEANAQTNRKQPRSQKAVLTAHFSQLAVELSKVRHAASITCPLSTDSKPLSGLWDVFAATSLLSARRPVAKLVSAAR